MPRDPITLPPSAPALTPDNYINRELSWLDFNRRVLAQAEDETLPLIERIKFLAIVSSNTDEFFMVRIATLHDKIKLGLVSSRPDGIAPAVLLAQLREGVLAIMRHQRELMTDLMGRLASHGVVLCTIRDLDAPQRAALRAYFAKEVYPILTPLAVDHARPFPFISNLSLNLAVILRRADDPTGETEFVRVKLPDGMPRLIDVSLAARRHHPDLPLTPGQTFIWLDDLIGENLDLLFPGMVVVTSSPFRVTRTADIDYEHELEEGTSDISQFVEEGLRERKFGSVVRLSVPDDIDRVILDRLLHHLDIVPDRDLYHVNGALGGSSLMQLAGLDKPALKYPVYIPRVPEGFGEGDDVFAAIRQRDHLVHHPYDSFLSVERFLQAAARDPQVLAIKATLYRVGRNSPVVQALMDARENGKQVAVLVELKARFDEENNLEWARALDDRGVHVTYGVEELPIKTHAKVALVVRHEADSVRRYVHLGTGNYNAGTARIYGDLGLFTCDPDIGEDASRLFNRLTGYAPATAYDRLLVAPEYLLPALIDRIDETIDAAFAGKPAYIFMKMNQLEEDAVIRKLYEASIAGVRVDLLIRGLCCLRPGIPGMSETIRVRSIVGRYLEHARIFYFPNAAPDRRLYLGSADVMRRNLYNRVEVVFPILDTHIQQAIRRIIATQLADNVDAWELGADGVYSRVTPAPGEKPLRSQEVFMRDSFGIDAMI